MDLQNKKILKKVKKKPGKTIKPKMVLNRFAGLLKIQCQI